MMLKPTGDRCCTGPYAGAGIACAACGGAAGGALRPCSHIVAESAAMRAVLERAAPIARSDAPVVVLGETGTGKEVLARALHASGPRAAGPFVALNCGAMPAELMESELFGHVRGAFSGAVGDKTGLFVEADSGTLLLDEIAELPLELQVKLLRVLQDGQVRRVGANHAVAVDVRVIAATHRPLRQLVERGAFREDLYYRLRVFQVTLPPLRDRSEDILPLAREILRGLAGAAKVLDPEAERALLAHRWPGNVRELVNAIRHGAALARTAVVEREDLPDDVTAPDRQQAETRTPPPGVVRAVAEIERELVGAATAGGGPLRTLAQVEREYILAVVRACHGNQSEAARVLGIGRNTLWRKLEAYRDEDDAAAATRDDQRAG